MKKVYFHGSFLTLALMGAALSSAAHAAQVTVFAATSLTDAFGEIGKAFEKQNGNSVTFQFAGSQTLRTQLENGAGADVFASANTAQYDPLVKSGMLEPGRIFAKNRLVVITPTGSRVKTLRDLASSGVKLVLADKTVPVGAYSRQMLEKLSDALSSMTDYVGKVLGNVVSEEINVRQVALKVALGEADAGIVYLTDVTPDLSSKVSRVRIPDAFNPVATYPIGVLKGANNTRAANTQAAGAFVDFVRSSAGQRILRKWGFQPGDAK